MGNQLKKRRRGAGDRTPADSKQIRLSMIKVSETKRTAYALKCVSSVYCVLCSVGAFNFAY